MLKIPKDLRVSDMQQSVNVQPAVIPPLLQIDYYQRCDHLI